MAKNKSTTNEQFLKDKFAKSKKRLAENAILAQDACNPSSIAYLLTNVFSLLSAEDADTKTKCEHPLVRLVVHKLADLCGMNITNPGTEFDKDTRYHQAYMAAKEMADD